MAGGTFKVMNKALPGAYIDIIAQPQTNLGDGVVSGVVFTVENGLNWGIDGVVEINAGSDFQSLFGMPITDPRLLGLAQILKSAQTVYVYNINAGTQATSSSAVLPWSFAANYNGTAGNAIALTVSPDPANVGQYIVQTTYSGQIVDTQTITGANQLFANGYVTPTILSTVSDNGAAMLGALVSPVVVTLAGGTSTTDPLSIDELQQAIDGYDYNILVAADVSDTANIHSLFAAAAQRNRDQLGRKIQAVVPFNAGIGSNYEGVITVGNSVKLEDGTILTQSQFAGLVAGAESAAQDNQSLTYATIIGAVDAVPRFSDEQLQSALANGLLVASYVRGIVRIEEDINSLTSTNSDVVAGNKSLEFGDNRVIRVLDYTANWVAATWENSFVGKVTNDAAGQDLLKATITEFLTGQQTIEAIQGFDPKDISIFPGNDPKSVVVSLSVEPLESFEKLYMTVMVQ